MKALFVAGEASGDLYGGKLATTLQKREPSLTLAGMGGACMESAGVKLLYDYRGVSVVGVFEILSKLQKLREAYRNVCDWVLAERPDFAVLIDFPDFNFRVARFLKSHGIKTFYFISPQVWAWRKRRVYFLRDHIDLMICVLPFEKTLYEQVGVPVEYVGHPLVEIVREELAGQPKSAAGANLRVGLMPGSRDVEVRRHFGLLRETLSRVRKEMPVDSVTIWPPSLKPEDYDAVGPELVLENRYTAMKSCDLMLVASGTSTLECAILQTPPMIVYRVNPVSWQLGKVLVRVPYYGLVNWIAGRKVIPEYIQQDMDPELLSRDALELLRHPERRDQMKVELAAIVDLLGPPGAIDRAADAMLKRL